MTTQRILVANIGSTSFKFRLYEMPAENLLAHGRVERIGGESSPWQISAGSKSDQGEAPMKRYEDAIEFVEARLRSIGLGGFDNVSAFGFKPVMAQNISGTPVLDERVLGAMEAMNTMFPAHNPPYIAAVRAFTRLYPAIPCIGTFETAFYDQLPEHNVRLPVPKEWMEKYGIRRFGFHGASHRYVTQRAAELRGTEKLRIISCHLGGSSSIAAVRDGVAIDSSWGMTAQSGVPHNNRSGDFDAFAVIYLARDLGLGIDEVERVLSRESGLKGMSGLDSGDLRDLREAAASGNTDARVALDIFVGSIRKFIGQFLVEMNGADLIVFTGGIGENGADIREAVCANLDFCGLELDTEINRTTHATETVISKPGSRIEVRVIPTNEELVIARNATKVLATL
jgi:acetate kinase